jgi:hypothetical protein
VPAIPSSIPPCMQRDDLSRNGTWR